MSKRVYKVRWNLNSAGAEFDIDPKTLSKRIKALALEPDAEGNYTTAQICAAVYGDIDGERLRLVRAQARRVEIENAEAEKRLIDVHMLAERVNVGLSAIRARILSAANMEQDDKDLILKECGELWSRALLSADCRETKSSHGGQAQLEDDLSA